uniref:Uncharacterized protein n=1 Tax=Helianthus annuus TaxID=4232 RepID=A0A251TJT4_HELAN
MAIWILIDHHKMTTTQSYQISGLAKDGPIGDKSHISTRVMGTYRTVQLGNKNQTMSRLESWDLIFC